MRRSSAAALPWLPLLWIATTVAIDTTVFAPNRWTLHDPDFPVRITVEPFADDQWDATQADLRDALAIPSTVLNITVELPAIANVTDTQVSVTMFGKNRKPRQQQSPRDSAADDEEEGITGDAAYVVLADTQMQYAQSYRLNVGADAQHMVMRVYVESQVASGRSMRALFARSLDLSPSEPMLLDCPASDGNSDVALRLTSYPPTNVPRDLCSAYTMGGRVPVRKWYFDDQTDTERTYEERSFEYIEELIEQAKQKKRYYYGVTDDYLYEALAKYPIRGQHVLIVGSTIPWYEAICIAMEAASCTTIDYNKLRYHHPKIQTYTLGEFESTASRTHFDAIFSISSFEHDGLGRYGDPLDPEADLTAMEGLLRYIKPTNRQNGGATKVYLAVPVGADAVVWNAQRIYGPLRLPLLMKDWSLVESFGFSKADFTAPFTISHQPLFVLEPKPLGPDEDSGHSELQVDTALSAPYA